VYCCCCVTGPGFECPKVTGMFWWCLAWHLASVVAACTMRPLTQRLTMVSVMMMDSMILARAVLVHRGASPSIPPAPSPVPHQTGPPVVLLHLLC